MKILYLLSDLMIPCIIFFIVGTALAARKKVYEDFTSGAKEGLRTAAKILPTLIGLMTAVGVLRASGFLDMAAEQLGKLTEKAGFPAALVPLSLVRLFSASAASGLLLDLYKEYGTDSFIGTTASLMMSCTETVFLHHVRLLCGGQNFKNPVHTLAGALLATAAGIAASLLLAGAMAA